MSVTLRAGGASDVGRVRENNQDSFLLGEGLYLVADGVGGHQGGEVASATAVEAMRTTFEQRTLTGLIQSVLRANRAVWERAQRDPQLRGMGTTVTGVALVQDEDSGEEQLAVINVGDSRAYLLQQGELTQLTEDHSLVEEMVREGRLTRQEADIHPQRSLITRALGLDANVSVDHWQLIPYAGDRILLCSDGLTNEVGDDKIASVLRRLADPQEAARELVALAKSNGGRDNITVVVVDIVDDEDRAARASEALAANRPRHESHSERIVDGDEEVAESGAVATATATTGAVHADEAETSARQEASAHAGPSPRPRVLTWRVAVFAVLLLGVLGGAVGVVGWYARRTFYVGLDGSQLAIYRGRPGGVLWVKPTLAERTPLNVADIPKSRVDEVTRGKDEPTLADAHTYVANLRSEAAAAQAAAGPTTTTIVTVLGTSTTRRSP